MIAARKILHFDYEFRRKPLSLLLLFFLEIPRLKFLRKSCSLKMATPKIKKIPLIRNKNRINIGEPLGFPRLSEILYQTFAPFQNLKLDSCTNLGETPFLSFQLFSQKGKRDRWLDESHRS